MTPADDADQQLLRGGSHGPVLRIGGTVRRLAGPHSKFTKDLLDSLEHSGVTAPRYLGIDDAGRDVLSYLDGEVRHRQPHFGDDELAAAITLVRLLHDATAGSPLAGDDEVVCHNDLAPWNLVWRDDAPLAFIDFDDAAPGSRSDDVAYFAWTFLGLGSDRPIAEQARRLWFVCDSYGAFAGAEITNAISRQQRRILHFREHQAMSATDQSRRVFAAERVQRIRADIDWLQAHRHVLER